MAVEDIRVQRLMGTDGDGEPYEHGYKLQVKYTHAPNGMAYDWVKDDNPWEDLTQITVDTGEVFPDVKRRIVIHDSNEE